MIPTYDQFIEPVLRYLASNPAGADADAVCEAVADHAGVSQLSREQTLRSGKLVYRSRIQWAHDRLKRAGFSHSLRRGIWRLTPAGLDFAHTNRGQLPPEIIRRLATKSDRARLRPRREDEDVLITRLPPTAAAALQDAIGKNLAVVTAQVLAAARRAPIARFHTLVCDLLAAQGYFPETPSRSWGYDVEAVFSTKAPEGRRVYVLAKQLWRSVGASRVRALHARMQAQGLTEGCFVSTSDFNKHAFRCVESLPGLKLLGGDDLAGLLIRLRVAVTCRTVEVPTVDMDYLLAGAGAD